MIPQANRLPSKTKLLSAVFIQTPFFSVKAAKNTEDKNRYAFVIGKKVDKRAVVRNRLRRVLREIIVQKVDQTEQKYDMVVVIKRNFTEIPREEIVKNAQEVFVKLTLR